MTHDERIEKVARAIYCAQGYIIPFEMQFGDELKAWRATAAAALAAAGVEEMEQEAARLRDAIAHAIIMLQTGMPEYDAHDVLDVLREVMGK
jgi:hypothetical protein